MVKVTPLTKKREIYSDFTKDLFRNPVNNDLGKRTNENSVKEAIKNLILTDKGERLFQPNVGSDAKKMLFSNFTPATTKILEEYVRDTIKTFEPRAELLDVSVIAYPDENALQITIAFSIELVEDPVTLDLFIDRLR
jgi:phage baseplate assembly protein W